MDPHFSPMCSAISLIDIPLSQSRIASAFRWRFASAFFRADSAIASDGVRRFGFLRPSTITGGYSGRTSKWCSIPVTFFTSTGRVGFGAGGSGLLIRIVEFNYLPPNNFKCDVFTTSASFLKTFEVVEAGFAGGHASYPFARHSLAGIYFIGGFGGRGPLFHLLPISTTIPFASLVFIIPGSLKL